LKDGWPGTYMYAHRGGQGRTGAAEMPVFNAGAALFVGAPPSPVLFPAGSPALPGALTPGPAPPPRPSTAPAWVSQGPVGSPVALLLALRAASSPNGRDVAPRGLASRSTPKMRPSVIRQVTKPASRLRCPERRVRSHIGGGAM